MILPITQSARFFDLFNSLSIYAHRRLRLMPDIEFFCGDLSNSIDEMAQRETMLEFWKHQELLDEFIRDNPFDLPQRDLDVTATWKGCDMSTYTVDTVTVGASEELYFCAGDHAVAVCGLSKPIESMLTTIPAVVQTVLLPFEGKVTYGMFILQMQLEMGDNMREILHDELQTDIAEGRVIRTGAQFMEKMPAIRAKAEQRQLEQFRRNIEMEERAQGPLPGQHRGVLAGLGEEERDRRVHEHIRELMRDEALSERFAEIMVSYCLPGEPVFTLEELLRRERETNAATAEQTEAGNTNDEFFHQLANPQILQACLMSYSEHEIEILRKLASRDGRWNVSPENISTLSGLPWYDHGLCYYFHDGDGYLAVMPKEVVEAARKVDWDETISYARGRGELMHFMEAIAELRGILTIDDAVKAYQVAYPNGIEEDEVVEILYSSLDSLQFSICMLETPDESYLVFFELFFDYLQSHGISPRDAGSYAEGELDGMPEAILKHQQGKEARALMPEMLACESLFDWTVAQPPALAMRNYLDAHVPDDADDYNFADKVMEDLLREIPFGFFESGTQVFFDILESNGFSPDYSQVNKLLGLWQNMCNGLPNWPNNGWSPNELHNRASRKTVFYNEDGSPMRVGRNDPCPCGSGKKYKRCCGR